jgi:2-polyprenyl-3-methyl-5-hydroxy-6-metoxy-1,4-benzoquinol methylase/uncharacterized protein YbaR (Trm112 family)
MYIPQHLVCPVDQSELTVDGEALVCVHGHRYPYIDGIPIMLVDDEATHRAAFADTRRYVETRLLQEERADGVDPAVQAIISGTNGIMYRSLVGRLTEYPIPDFRLEPAHPAQLLLDIGCAWGRWCVSAARQGFYPIGIDPNVTTVRAARRVAAQLGVTAEFLVADARCLPFRDGMFDVAFSYSVLQHFSKPDARRAIAEAARVLASDGTCMIQMPNVFGLRSLYHQVRRSFRDPGGFGVRYWTPRELLDTFSSVVGPSELSVDGFFSLNPQPAEARLLPRRYRAVVRTSELLRRTSTRVPALLTVADSLYVSSTRATQ